MLYRLLRKIFSGIVKTRQYLNTKEKVLSISLSFLITLVLFLFPNNVRADASAALTSNTILPNDGRPSSTNVTYTVTFTFPDATGTVSCIQIPFGTTSALTTPATGMTYNSGGSISGGGLTAGNWTGTTTTNGTLQLDIAANTANSHTATAVTVTLTGVTNTSITNPTDVFAQINVYPTSNGSHVCSGTVAYQSPVMALTYTSGVTASVTVDPTLSFTVANYGSAVNGGSAPGITSTATTIPFGSVAAGSAAVNAAQLLTVSTNAAHGYAVYLRDSASLTDANSDTVRDQACASSDCTTLSNAQTFDGSTSQSSFGYTADGPNQTITSNKWLGLTTSQVKIASRTTAQNADAFHVGYQLEISNVQPPGTYTTNVIYTAAPTY